MKRVSHLLAVGVVFGSIVLTLALPQPTYAASSCLRTYTVRRGDNLFRIGLRFGVRFTRLQALNGLPNPNRIFVGERLCVRGSGTAIMRRQGVSGSRGSSSMPAQPGDSTSSQPGRNY